MGEKKGIVLSGPDGTIEAQTRNKKLGVVVGGLGDGQPQGLSLPFDKVLFVEPGTEVPWDLLPAAWHFLERWDAAVPLWRYGVTAADVGSKEERKRTQAVVRDLRVLLHSVELLFVRNTPDQDGQTLGRDLIAAYREELGIDHDGADHDGADHDGADHDGAHHDGADHDGADHDGAHHDAPLQEGVNRRLAFLRALYRVKPRLCVLPVTWLAKVAARSKQDAIAVRGRGRPTGQRLVEVELGPGRFVKCNPGDEDAVLKMLSGRRGDDKK